MALVGGDDIQVHQDNDDHNNGNDNAVNTGDDQDATGTTTATGAAGGTGTTQFNLGLNRARSQNSLAPKAKIQFRLQTSSDDLKIWQKQTDGRMPRPTTISPTQSAIWLANGSHQWWTGMMMNETSQYGPNSKTFSNKNMQSR
jgi:hypothetical protein